MLQFEITILPVSQYCNLFHELNIGNLRLENARIQMYNPILETGYFFPVRTLLKISASQTLSRHV